MNWLNLLLPSVVTLFIFLISWKIGIDKYNTVRKHKLFESYSIRYTEVISSLLTEVEDFNNNFIKQSPFQRKKTLEYFMLISEEFYLKDKYIDKDIWSMWKQGIETHMDKPFFQTAWIYAKEQMDFKGDFTDFIEALKK